MTATQFNRLLVLLGCGPDCPMGPTHIAGDELPAAIDHLLDHLERKLKNG